MATAAIGAKDYDVMANTALVGVAAGYLFNPVVGLTCMVVNAALAIMNEEHTRGAWYPLHRGWTELSTYYSSAMPFFITHCIYEVAYRIFLNISISEIAIGWFKNAWNNPLVAVHDVAQLCLIAPLVQEIVFRGFLQEKFRDVQVLILGRDRADNTVHKSMRIATQALLCGATYYFMTQSPLNNVIALCMGTFALAAGVHKEERGDLWQSTGSHSHLALYAHINTPISSRGWFSLGFEEPSRRWLSRMALRI